MEISEILNRCDHTLLAQDSTWEQIRALCDEGIKYSCASVCIPPSFVRRAKEYVGGRLKICTVIGFPNGYNTAEVKAFEASDAVNNGADEIDMVINVGSLKDQDYAAVTDEIALVKKACRGRLLKVIIETCLLSEREKAVACVLIARAGADYVKTSTGFSKGGATHEDVKKLAGYIAAINESRRLNGEEELKLKAAGGIKDLEDAAQYIEEGADRLGTSRVVRAAKALEH